MNNSITGYNAGRTNPYRQVETRPAAAADGQDPARPAAKASDLVRLGSELSEAEAGMIEERFPDSEKMRLRLYGPGSRASSVDPGARGGRLDLRG